MNAGTTPLSTRPSALPPKSGFAAEDVAPADTAAVLQHAEVERARVFFRVVAGVAVLVLGFLPLLPGPVALRAVVGAALAVTAAMFGALLLYIRGRDARYTPRLVTAAGVTSATLGVLVIYYIGLFSAGAMILALGVHFFGSSRSRLAARVTYASVALLYLGATLGIALGVLPDASLFSTSSAAAVSRYYQVFMSQVIFAMSFYLARSSRRSMETAANRIQEDTRLLQQRDAMLAEARRELDRALRPGDGPMTGERIGSYLLGEVIGKGGMGEVYKGEDTKRKRPVAIKLLHPSLVENEEHVKRFLREAQAAAAVRTEHVAEILEAGFTTRGVPYLVMELLEGHDLGWHLRKTGRLPLKSVVELVEQVARALASVREAGIVHRDLKPGNLFLTDSIPRRWKVLDFGLSKILASGSTLTRDHAVGTPSYMAPEQVNAGEIDARADLYALAGIAYRAITGSPPFPGDDVTHILFRVLYAQPEAPARFVRLPVEVELVLAIGLAKKPEDRFDRVEELAAALKGAAAGDLDDATRARGWALVKEYPWGSTRSARERLVSGRSAR